MKAGTCKHFTGWRGGSDERCAAGVCYRDVIPEPNRPGAGLRKPCHSVPVFTAPHQLEEHAKRGTCAKYAEPTAEDIAEHEREWRAAEERLRLAEPIRREVKKQHRGRYWSGVLVCPACGGRLHMEHHTNGHTGGRCETADCMNWRE